MMGRRVLGVWLSSIVLACATGGGTEDDAGNATDAPGYDATKPDTGTVDNYVPDTFKPDTSTNDVVTTPDSGPPDVVTVDASCTSCPFELLYKCLDTNSTSQEPKTDFEIINQGSSAQAYTGLKIRYWFTGDGVTAYAFNCYYAAIGNGNVSGTVYAMDAGTDAADHYLEVTFSGSAGTLGPDASSGEIQAAFHGSNNYPVMTQTNDYSFDPTKTSFLPWTNVTLYQNGNLVWGTEP
jgi:hypothetical protein